jgi:uncharacterized membrane protein
MDNYLLLKITHSVPAILLFVGLLVHVLMLFKAARSGDAAVLQRKLRRTRMISLPLLGVLALSLPVTGWCMVNSAGLPLGQLWLLLSSGLYVLLMLLGLLLAGRLGAWQALGATPAPASLLRWTAIYAGLMVLLLLAILGLMGAKPV